MENNNLPDELYRNNVPTHNAQEELNEATVHSNHLTGMPENGDTIDMSPFTSVYPDPTTLGNPSPMVPSPATGLGAASRRYTAASHETNIPGANITSPTTLSSPYAPPAGPRPATAYHGPSHPAQVNGTTGTGSGDDDRNNPSQFQRKLSHAKEAFRYDPSSCRTIVASSATPVPQSPTAPSQAGHSFPPNITGVPGGPFNTTSIAMARQSAHRDPQIQPGTANARILADQPAMRVPHQRVPDKVLNYATKPKNVEAFLGHIAGTEAAAGQQCNRCADGKGPWTTCVFYPDKMRGACANCWYGDRGTHCSHHQNNREQAEQGPHHGLNHQQQQNSPQQPPQLPQLQSPFSVPSGGQFSPVQGAPARSSAPFQPQPPQNLAPQPQRDVQSQTQYPGLQQHVGTQHQVKPQQVASIPPAVRMPAPIQRVQVPAANPTFQTQTQRPGLQEPAGPQHQGKPQQVYPIPPSVGMPAPIQPVQRVEAPAANPILSHNQANHGNQQQQQQAVSTPGPLPMTMPGQPGPFPHLAANPILRAMTTMVTAKIHSDNGDSAMLLEVKAAAESFAIALRRVEDVHGPCIPAMPVARSSGGGHSTAAQPGTNQEAGSNETIGEQSK